MSFLDAAGSSCDDPCRLEPHRSFVPNFKLMQRLRQSQLSHMQATSASPSRTDALNPTSSTAPHAQGKQGSGLDCAQLAKVTCSTTSHSLSLQPASSSPADLSSRCPVVLDRAYQLDRQSVSDLLHAINALSHFSIDILGRACQPPTRFAIALQRSSMT